MADRKLTSDDAAMKTRIITHMNNDHASSLSFYLQHYSSFPPRVADTAKLTDISLSRLTLSTADEKTIYLPIRPSPMSSLSEARARLSYMSNECMVALDLSPHVVTSYKPPRLVESMVIFSVLFGLWAFSSKNSFAEGSFIRTHILRDVAPLADFLQTHQVACLVLTIAVHLLECVYLQRSRLRKHQVRVCSQVWWLWIGTCFLEGFGCFKRFDRVVKGVEEKAKKH